MANTGMDSVNQVKKVTEIGITEGIETAKGFVTKLDENVEQILNKYTEMNRNNVLSSAEIDAYTEEIKTRIDKMKTDFDELSANIRNDMQQSVENINAESNTIQL